MGQEPHLFLVGPYQLYLDCLAVALAATRDLTKVPAGQVLGPDLRVPAAHPFRLVVVDVALLKEVGVEWVRWLTRDASSTKVLALGCADEEQAILDCIEAGATGAHLKEEPLDSLVCAIGRLARGEPICPPKLFPSLLARLAAKGRGNAADDLALTLRERDIHPLLADGLSNKQIATRLNLSIHTVKNHVHRILEKLQVAQRARW
jgi:DNA-binding NarL/FixJ family response regulator